MEIKTYGKRKIRALIIKIKAFFTTKTQWVGIMGVYLEGLDTSEEE